MDRTHAVALLSLLLAPATGFAAVRGARERDMIVAAVARDP